MLDRRWPARHVEPRRRDTGIRNGSVLAVRTRTTLPVLPPAAVGFYGAVAGTFCRKRVPRDTSVVATGHQHTPRPQVQPDLFTVWVLSPTDEKVETPSGRIEPVYGPEPLAGYFLPQYIEQMPPTLRAKLEATMGPAFAAYASRLRMLTERISALTEQSNEASWAEYRAREQLRQEEKKREEAAEAAAAAVTPPMPPPVPVRMAPAPVRMPSFRATRQAPARTVRRVSRGRYAPSSEEEVEQEAAGFR